MRPVEPRESIGGVAVRFRSSDPTVADLLARTDGTVVVSEWELTAEELARVVSGAPVRLTVWSGGAAIHPVALEVPE